MRRRVGRPRRKAGNMGTLGFHVEGDDCAQYIHPSTIDSQDFFDLNTSFAITSQSKNSSPTPFYKVIEVSVAEDRRACAAEAKTAENEGFLKWHEGVIPA